MIGGWPTSNGPVQASLIDWWTIPHMMTGAACRLLGMDAKDALIVALGWELLENLGIMPRTNWNDETFINSVGDVGANMAGYFLTEKLL